MIRRDPKGAVKRDHDLIVVGGGIYGVAATLEAARRGLRPLLLERNDFGGATSRNSLATIHGGLRYLQNLDIRRYLESTDERRRFLREFPDLVAPLPCLMPLYGKGTKRPGLFRIANAMNEALSADRNEGVRIDRHLGKGEVIGPEETIRRFPAVRRKGLRGGGVWCDASTVNAPRLLLEMLRWAAACGGEALNYVEATGLVERRGRATGIEAVDRLTGEAHAYRARAVLNCSGPWSRDVACAFDRDVPDLFRPSLAFNALLDREPPSDHAIAAAPPEKGGRVYFLIPRGRRVFAGTYHASTSGSARLAEVPDEDLSRFLGDLNRAVPEFGARKAHVLRLYAGLLPVRERETVHLATREIIYDHGESEGPRGLLSISGVKYTTARLVAEKALDKLFMGEDVDLRVRPGAVRPEPLGGIDLSFPGELLAKPDSEVLPPLRRIVDEEAVVYVEDLVDRRTDWAAGTAEGEACADRVARLIPELPLRP
ncbi:MAG: FAD-dependent oxidoreductase [Candidatus Eisenbacteria bacterium]